jgi:hypothetical protein
LLFPCLLRCGVVLYLLHPPPPASWTKSSNLASSSIFGSLSWLPVSLLRLHCVSVACSPAPAAPCFFVPPSTKPAIGRDRIDGPSLWPQLSRPSVDPAIQKCRFVCLSACPLVCARGPRQTGVRDPNGLPARPHPVAVQSPSKERRTLPYDSGNLASLSLSLSLGRNTSRCKASPPQAAFITTLGRNPQTCNRCIERCDSLPLPPNRPPRPRHHPHCRDCRPASLLQHRNPPSSALFPFFLPVSYLSHLASRPALSMDSSLAPAYLG